MADTNGVGVPGADARGAGERSLAETVLGFLQSTSTWPDRHLENEAWGWDEYEELRYAHLHTAMTLRAFAARILEERARSGPLDSLAQHALGDAQVAFRSLEALLRDVPDDHFDREPAPMEYPLRQVLAHVVETELYFEQALLNAMAVPPGSEPDMAKVQARMAPARDALNQGTLAEAWAAFANLHAEVTTQFAQLTNLEVERPSALWESQPYPILWRLWRFGAHLREHTVQVAKTLEWLGVRQNESQRHAHDVAAALGQVEAARLGGGAVGAEASWRIAEELAARYAQLFAAYDDIGHFVAAVEEGNVPELRSLLAARPALARTRVTDDVSALLYSLYRGRSEAVNVLLEAGVRMGLHDSAAMGNVERLELLLTWYPGLLDAHARDGFTPLQLASYFGRTDAVRFLLEKGADPNTISHNGQALRAIHSATAARSAEIVAMLIAAGADLNAHQEGGLTPLMAAQQHGDTEILTLLRSAGATD